MKIEDLSTVTVILRGYTYSQVEAVVKAMQNTSFNTVEITTNSPNAFETIKKISEKYPDINVGVGTVLNKEHVEKAIESGAKFILSPICLEKELIDMCKEKGMLVVAAAFSPTEVYKMVSYGADVVKVFPAKEIGASYAKAIQGPLGELNLMAVGGVNSENSLDFLNNGYKYLGIGSGVFNKEDIINENIENMKKSIKQFIEKVEVMNE